MKQERNSSFFILEARLKRGEWGKEELIHSLLEVQYIFSSNSGTKL
jgi:hypothetical protein